MAGRRRRKLFPLQGVLVNLAAICFAFMCLGAVGYGVWRLWPAAHRTWDRWSAAAWAAETDPAAADKRREKNDPPPPGSTEHFKRDNDALRSELRRLREQLQRTSEALTQKTAQLEEMRLQRLILDRTRAGQP